MNHLTDKDKKRLAEGWASGEELTVIRTKALVSIAESLITIAESLERANRRPLMGSAWE